MFWKRKKEEAETVIVVSRLGDFAWQYSTNGFGLMDPLAHIREHQMHWPLSGVSGDAKPLLLITSQSDLEMPEHQTTLDKQAGIPERDNFCSLETIRINHQKR